MGQFLAIAFKLKQVTMSEQKVGQDILKVWLDQSDSLKASKEVL